MYNKLLMNDSAPLLAAPLLKKEKEKRQRDDGVWIQQYAVFQFQATSERLCAVFFSSFLWCCCCCY
jgi:hypothetical protein